MKIKFGGHSTVLVEIGKRKILTDPILATHLFILKRYNPPGLSQEDLDTVDTVILSHAHLDHLDKATLKRIPKTAKVFTVGQIREIPDRMGFHSTGMEVGETITEGDLQITCLPAKHFGGRWQITGDAKKYFFASFLIKSLDTGEVVYFGGDTAYANHFKEISAQEKRIDLALLPIGAYEPRSMTKDVHMNPLEAVMAMQDLDAKKMIPIHFGTFKMAREPIEAPPLVLVDEATRLGLIEKIRILKPSETFVV